jgi:hypothetical protein
MVSFCFKALRVNTPAVGAEPAAVAASVAEHVR